MFEYPPKKINNFDPLYGVDARSYDLNSVDLHSLSFDSCTQWPKNLDNNKETPEEILEKGKNPGLGIRELHKKGIDGSGVMVAIIDQKLTKERDADHKEYKNSIVEYKEYGSSEGERTSMHGPAVSSLFVGESCGVAPGAKLVFKATPSGRDFSEKANALRDIIEENKSREDREKIKIVSCSFGYMEENFEPGLKEWIETKKNAEASGIFVLDVNEMPCSRSKRKGDGESFDDYTKCFDYEKRNIVPKDDDIFAPTDCRTYASLQNRKDEYRYDGQGGMSWAVPFVAGIFTLALQVNPDLNKEQFLELVKTTAKRNINGIKMINPEGIIEGAKQQTKK